MQRRDDPLGMYQRGIADLASRRMASCSAEAVEPSSGAHVPMVVTLFEIPSAELPAFYEREEEFLIESVPYFEGVPPSTSTAGEPKGSGLMCLASSDAHYLATR